MKVTVLGDAMNAAARLEEHGKTIVRGLKTTPTVTLVADAETAKLAEPGAFRFQDYGEIQLRGKSIMTGLRVAFFS